MRPKNSAAPPHVIEPTAVYTPEQVRHFLHLHASTLKLAKAEQGLVAIHRGRQELYLGEDLLAWLRAGRTSRGGRNLLEGSLSPGEAGGG